MIIRFMTISDYDAVYKLWAQTPGMGLYAHDDSKEGINRYLQRNPTTCFVAEVDHQIVGAVLSGHDGRRGSIYHLAVSSVARRKGIGTQLLEHVLAALRSEGIHKAALVVFANNETGNAFWESSGFSARTDLIYRNKIIDFF